MNRQFCDRVLRSRPRPILWQLAAQVEAKRKSRRTYRTPPSLSLGDHHRRRGAVGTSNQTEMQTNMLETLPISWHDRIQRVRRHYHQSKLDGGDEHGSRMPPVPTPCKESSAAFSSHTHVTNLPEPRVRLRLNHFGIPHALGFSP